MRQFEIWWAELPLPVGTRPVLLLSRSDAYAYLSHVIVAEVSTTIRGIPQEVALGRREGMSRPCVANCDNVQSVPVESLVERVGGLTARRIIEVKRALGFALGWVELTSL